MKRISISDVLIKIIIACVGIMAIIYSMESTFFHGINNIWIVLSALLFCIAGVLAFAARNRSIPIILLASITVLEMVAIPTSIPGIKLLLNDCNMYISAYRSTGSGIIINPNNIELNAAKLCSILMLMLIMSFVISFIVMKIKSVLAALIVQVIFIIVPIWINVIPSIHSFVLIIVFILGVAGIENKKTYQGRSAVGVMVLSIIVAFVYLKEFPQESFVVPQYIRQINDTCYGYINNHNNKESDYVVGEMGIGNGQLGKVDEVQYSHKLIYEITTIDTGKDQYYPLYYGKDYKENSWSSDIYQDQDKRRLYLVFSAMTALGMNSAIDETEYKNYTMKVYFHVTHYITKKTQYYYDNINYSKFNYFLEHSESNNNLDIDEKRDDYITIAQKSDIKRYITWEKENRKNVYNNYLTVDNDLRNIIESQIGVAEPLTTEQKLQYIDYVKDYLANNYTYTYKPGRISDGQDFITHFLLEGKKGYCTYFASAAVMMYRCAGIPARYVEGYVMPRSKISTQATGEDSETQYTFLIDDTCAHAWVEVYMDGVGWVQVEVTPASGYVEANGNEGEGQAVYNWQSETTSLIQKNEEETSKAALETDVANESSDVNDVTAETLNDSGVQNVSYNEETENKKLNIALLIVVIIPFLIFLNYLALLYKKKIRRNRLFSRRNRPDNNLDDDILNMYNYLEEFLSHTIYKREKNMDYEQYCEWLNNLDLIFRQNNIEDIIQTVLMVRFSGKANSITLDKYETVGKEILAIRNGLYVKMPWIKKLYINFVVML